MGPGRGRRRRHVPAARRPGCAGVVRRPDPGGAGRRRPGRRRGRHLALATRAALALDPAGRGPGPLPGRGCSPGDAGHAGQPHVQPVAAARRPHAARLPDPGHRPARPGPGPTTAGSQRARRHPRRHHRGHRLSDRGLGVPDQPGPVGTPRRSVDPPAAGLLPGAVRLPGGHRRPHRLQRGRRPAGGAAPALRHAAGHPGRRDVLHARGRPHRQRRPPLPRPALRPGLRGPHDRLPAPVAAAGVAVRPPVATPARGGPASCSWPWPCPSPP